MGNSIDSFNDFFLSWCESCIKRKQYMVEFLKRIATQGIEFLELIHSDICGPLDPPTHIRNQYFITFI